MSDSGTDANLKAFDNAIDELKRKVQETDVEIEVVEYLTGVGEEIKQAFSDVAQGVNHIQALPDAGPGRIAEHFGEDILPLLRRGVAAAQSVHPRDATLAEIHAVGTRALLDDLAAFEKLAAAYRLQSQRLVREGRSLRESSARSRREWLTQTLVLGRRVGLYDSDGPQSPPSSASSPQS